MRSTLLRAAAIGERALTSSSSYLWPLRALVFGATNKLLNCGDGRRCKRVASRLVSFVPIQFISPKRTQTDTHKHSLCLCVSLSLAVANNVSIAARAPPFACQFSSCVVPFSIRASGHLIPSLSSRARSQQTMTQLRQQRHTQCAAAQAAGADIESQQCVAARLRHSAQPLVARVLRAFINLRAALDRSCARLCAPHRVASATCRRARNAAPPPPPINNALTCAQIHKAPADCAAHLSRWRRRRNQCAAAAAEGDVLKCAAARALAAPMSPPPPMSPPLH